MKEHCNLWRNWGDIDDSWDSVTSITDYFAENQDRIQPHAAPGHWNDPDMVLSFLDFQQPAFLLTLKIVTVDPWKFRTKL